MAQKRGDGAGLGNDLRVDDALNPVDGHLNMLLQAVLAGLLTETTLFTI